MRAKAPLAPASGREARRSAPAPAPAASLLACASGWEGQASVEAALLVPSLLVVLALLVQPACLLYTRAVMSSAAAETARMAATASSADDAVAFAKRRLCAVPEVSAFHAGGEDDWSVEVEGTGTGKARVTITGHARPLPLTAAIAGALSGSDADGVRLEVTKEVQAHASWVEGSYSDWVGIWG